MFIPCDRRAALHDDSLIIIQRPLLDRSCSSIVRKCIQLHYDTALRGGYSCLDTQDHEMLNELLL